MLGQLKILFLRPGLGFNCLSEAPILALRITSRCRNRQRHFVPFGAARIDSFWLRRTFASLGLKRAAAAFCWLLDTFGTLSDS